MATKDTKAETGRGKGRGRGKGSGKGGGRASSGTFDTARRLQELDGHSVEAESNFEILRAQRAAARQGKKTFKDIRENEGVDEDDPLNSIDDGIRLEPFNMRREMREGHFDESGFYVLNKDEEKKVTDAWLDTVDQAERTATFKAAEKQNKASNAAANRLNAMAKNLGPDSEGEEDEDDKDDKDEKDEEEEKEKAKEAAKEEEEPEEDKEAEERNIINMLEELIVFLQPLETPAMALGRIRRGGTPKAQAEAAKAFAAEMKMSRNIARALVPEQGPEAAAIVNLNSEDGLVGLQTGVSHWTPETRDVREKAMPKAPEEQPADGPPRPGQKRKQVSEGDVEKRETWQVLVYDSARELLAIDVRQRKGEQLAPDADAKAPSAEAAPKAAAAKAATPTPEVQYTNKRFKAENGTSTAVTEMSDAATAAATVSAARLADMAGEAESHQECHQEA
ncbi:CD2 antigen cytoplasmic tail-binding protein 2 (CD2 cytoplasmic domain-binding protein 2) (CD2 tail-binding protein 2) (U5 snRNP 52K protein) (U5-52K) [Durusdinium trenchii]|uniref:CD2 antigen cytoplasmic tail-binding protein 2 (CD2 cytoplasmic domain-binding protein 2) (CD2 tail-binding protein 2) (U5 snRNP 52K protein) (U5-52K) n=1 Tax=Durusdinium trenchii TaxID=1381693 RepID=A0ABP0JE13_9DINO